MSSIKIPAFDKDSVYIRENGILRSLRFPANEFPIKMSCPTRAVHVSVPNRRGATFEQQ